MLFELLKNNLGRNGAPFAAIVMFVIVVGLSLWLTPRIAAWIDKRGKDIPGFYDGMHEQPPEEGEK